MIPGNVNTVVTKLCTNRIESVSFIKSCNIY